MKPEDIAKVQAFCTSKNAELPPRPVKKREPFLKELLTLFSCYRARRELRRIEREADRIAAGIYTKEEQQNNRERWSR